MRTDPAHPLAGRRVLVGISGSIAAVKLPLVVSSLVQSGAEVRCLVTPSAAQLVSPVALASLSRNPCNLDADQWSHRAARPLHVELAEWAELVLVAPLSATSLGRWVHGLADSLLASTLLATEAPDWTRELTTRGSLTAAMLPLIPTNTRRPASGCAGSVLIKGFLIHQMHVGASQLRLVDRQGTHQVPIG